MIHDVNPGRQPEPVQQCRAIYGSAKGTRIELLLFAADMNPYLATAASLAAGLEGIERKLGPPAPATNGYTAQASTPLPRDFSEAVAWFRHSEMARKWFGAEFVGHYAGTGEWEIRRSPACRTGAPRYA